MDINQSIKDLLKGRSCAQFCVWIDSHQTPEHIGDTDLVEDTETEEIMSEEPKIRGTLTKI